MDDKRFDDVSKRLGAAQLTRGHLLRGVLGAAAAAVTGGVLFSGEADAKRNKGKGRRKGKSKGGHAKTARQNPAAQTAEGACRASGHPCEGGQVCCSGLESCQVTGPGNAKRCIDNPNCGASGQACCDGEPQCETGLTCQNDICVPNNPDCGAQGQPCCENGNPCQGGLTCQSGTCQPACGASGEICCTEDHCDEGLECQGGSCVVPCGGTSEICCGNDACDPHHTCVGDPGTCQPCGGDGEICCGGTACDSPLQCVNGTCVSVQPGGNCTTDADCPPGSVCNNGTCVSFGIGCKSGETALQCCYRSVKKGCKRKQQSAHARRNCLKSGKRRCRKLLGSV